MYYILNVKDKSRGPLIDPFGTPEVILSGSDFVWPTCTNYVLFDKCD